MRQEFKVHLLTDEGLALCHELAERFSELASWIEAKGLRCPEQTIAFRKLEEACFYAKKSIAIEHQKHEV